MKTFKHPNNKNHCGFSMPGLSHFFFLVILYSAYSAANACETEPMQGYEGPCEIYTKFDPAGRFIYTKPSGVNTIKKWSLETGKVLEEFESETGTFPVGVRPEDQLRQYPQDGEYIVMAEARDKNIALLSGKLGKIKEAQFLFDFDKQEVLWKTDYKYKKNNRKYYTASPARVSPDGTQFTIGDALYTVGEQGRRGFRLSMFRLNMSQDFSTAFKSKGHARDVMLRERVNPSTFASEGEIKGWFTSNKGFFPVDKNTGWIFIDHHEKDKASEKINSHKSKVAALHLVNFDSGEKLNTIVFDKREDPVEKRLREYLALKLDYAKKRLHEQVELLSTPEYFLLRDRKYNSLLLGGKHLLLTTNSRKIIFDAESWRPKALMTPRGYKYTILSSVEAERRVEVREGLGSSPNYAYFYSPVFIEASQTFLGQSHSDVYEFDLNGKTLAKRFADTELIGTIGGREVVVGKRNKKACSKFEVRNIDSGKKIRSLKGKSENCIAKLSASGKYLFVDQGWEKNKYVYDTSTGKQVLKTKDRITLAYEGMLDLQTGIYTGFANLREKQLVWKHRKNYKYRNIQGQYILTWAKGQGIEVFDIASNQYLTPAPLDTGYPVSYADSQMHYLPYINTVVITALSQTPFGWSKTKKTGALGYSIDLMTFDMRPLAVHAMPWDDPLVAIRDEERRKQKAAEEARQQAEIQRQQELAAQEKALLAHVDSVIQTYPDIERLALFYPDGPLGPFVSNERKAQALLEHMDWWALPNHHTSTYGLIHVPFAFVEELIPFLPEERAKQARSVLPRIRNKQLADQKHAQEQADIARMYENIRRAVSTYKPPREAPTTLNRHSASDYQEWHYLYGTGSCGSAANPCGPGDDTRAYR